MTLRVLDRLTEPGGAAANEDAVGHSRSAAWVLDGATGLSETRLLPGPSDAAWLAATYSRLLGQTADAAGTELGPLLAELAAEAARAFEAERLRPAARRFELPSAGLVLARARDGRLEYARLGDCRAIVRLRDARGREEVVTTGRSPLHRLDEGVVRKMAALLRGGSAGYAEARRAVQEDLRANRDLMNTPGGYWVLGTDPEAARHAELGSLDLRGRGAEGLLVSDGFYRLVDTFGACRDDAALLAAARSRGLAAMLAGLRGLEDADPDCASHPRLKPKDDATALLFEVPPGGG